MEIQRAVNGSQAIRVGRHTLTHLHTSPALSSNKGSIPFTRSNRILLSRRCGFDGGYKKTGIEWPVFFGLVFLNGPPWAG
jgi:hypothetical protein